VPELGRLALAEQVAIASRPSTNSTGFDRIQSLREERVSTVVHLWGPWHGFEAGATG
jgi:hypothetical protein